ncbi:spidroin-2-like [Triticum dicoccoides]|uniref:spidroin-2-like n=1 Tax=Triticum dicoccoides TaxID=85692 RepID=UPI00189169D1|nr:spidroin-2-like [Triticum dicoccoides]
MGKKQSGNGGVEKVAAREFSLKVAMHCRCHGCSDKLRAAVRDLTLAPGVEAVDQTAAEATGEVRVLATADPERLRKGLRKATGKKVDLVFPPAKERRKGEGEDARAVDAAAVQALLADLQLHHQYGGQAAARHQYGGQGAAAAAWAASQQHQQQLLGLGGGWNGAGAAGGYGAAYPWQPSSAASYYPAAPAAGAGWGAYGGYGYAPQAQAPAQGHGGYYGASSPAWHGQGY